MVGSDAWNGSNKDKSNKFQVEDDIVVFSRAREQLHSTSAMADEKAKDLESLILPKNFSKSKNTLKKLQEKLKGSKENARHPLMDTFKRTDYRSLPMTKLFTIDDLLTPAQCNVLIKKTNKMNYSSVTDEYPEDYRKCERIICKSHNLASLLWSALIPHLTRSDVENIKPFGFGASSGIWRPTHLNEAIRFTRYRNGDFFHCHRDGAYVKSTENRSVYTIMIYLNDAKSKDFKGGETVFYSLPNKEESQKLFFDDDDLKNAMSVTIKPKKGMAVIFNHDIWHRGNPVITQKDKQYKV